MILEVETIGASQRDIASIAGDNKSKYHRKNSVQYMQAEKP